MNCELMLTYDTPALRQTGSRNLTGQKTLPTKWGTYMKLVTKYQISAINSCWEKCDEKWAYMFNVYKNQQSLQTGNRNLTGPKMLPTIWHTYIWSLWPNIRFLKDGRIKTRNHIAFYLNFYIPYMYVTERTI